MQKDLLGQDVFLIGPPGPLRRAVAMMYSVSTLCTSLFSPVVVNLILNQKVIPKSKMYY